MPYITPLFSSFRFYQTRTSLVPAVTEYVKMAHTYEVPEVLVLPVSGGNEEYLKWVRSSATGVGVVDEKKI